MASSMRGADGEPGALYALDASGASRPVKLYPSEPGADELDRARFRDRPGPPDAKSFCPHGLNVRPLNETDIELYVVNHGGRESIEFFRVRVNGPMPRAHWIGCVLLPDHAFGNGVAPLPDGGLVVTNMYDPSDRSFMSKFAAGRPTGGVLRWEPAAGWSQAVSHLLSGANGVEVTPDGDSIFVSEWAARRLWSFSLTDKSAARSIDLEFLPDNLRWTERGTLLLAGQDARPEEVFGCEGRHAPCPLGFTVAEVVPERLSSRVLVRGGDGSFGGATGALLVGSDLWVGSFRGDIVGRFIPAARKEGR
ncbi:SMP-30/gluconolactonase/LRE family protein [Frigoriglobus tundricola]|uniref:hypothetical protein n=1 Tax=Frigoriglobus tundricola TaxID=2774151 RepID=UPI00148EAC28|nr:hypothetical protein [Frigoriglobus tundricola]